MQLAEKQDISVRLDVSTSAAVLPTNFAPSPRVRHDINLESIAVSTQKAISFEAIARCLWSIGEIEQHPSVSQLLAFSLESSFTELPKQQNRFLEELGFAIRTSEHYEIFLSQSRITLSISFEVEEREWGSFYQKIKTKVSVNSNDTKDVLKTVLATLIASALTSCANSPEPMDFEYSLRDRPIYICTINSAIQGDNEALVRKAAAMLSTTQFLSRQHEVEVWKARQMCLAAAGFDPGPIDGIPGERTMRAAESYSAAFDNVQVLWSSSVFARHLIYHSFARHELLRQMK